jgi:hypothetical protein
MSLFDMTIWITSSKRLYEMYVGYNNDDLVWTMQPDDRMNFVLMVWNSEGCPDI